MVDPPRQKSRWRENSFDDGRLPFREPLEQPEPAFDILISKLTREFNFAKALIHDLRTENVYLRGRLVEHGEDKAREQFVFGPTNGCLKDPYCGGEPVDPCRGSVRGPADAAALPALPTILEKRASCFALALDKEQASGGKECKGTPDVCVAAAAAPFPSEDKNVVGMRTSRNSGEGIRKSRDAGEPVILVETPSPEQTSKFRMSARSEQGNRQDTVETTRAATTRAARAGSEERRGSASSCESTGSTGSEEKRLSLALGLNEVYDTAHPPSRPSLTSSQSSSSDADVSLSGLSPLQRRRDSETQPRRRMTGADIVAVARRNSGAQQTFLHSKSSIKQCEHIRSGDELVEDCFLQKFAVRPTSRVCVAWDCVTCVVMVHDLIMIPLHVYDLPLALVLGLDWITASVWTLDVVFCFFRGVDIEGVLELRPSQIAKSYLASWFALDITVVSLDWLLIAEMTSSVTVEFLKNVRARRLLRILRIVRLIRLAKLANRDTVIQFVHFEHYVAALSICKFLLVICVVNHYISCGWYAVGGLGLARNWIDENFNEGHSTLYRYCTAFHWSITQFTPASMEVGATNEAERVYSLISILFGLVMFSSFVSHMTSAVSNFQKLTAGTEKQRRDLRKYISDHQISFNLANAITNFVKTAVNRNNNKRLLESDISCFRILPDNLVLRLHGEVFTPIIAGHPLFRKIQDVEPGAFLAICNLALVEKNVFIGEELFRYGARATKMYFSTSGQLAYFPGVHDSNPVTVSEDTWFSEATLWCKWRHAGRMMSSFAVAEVVCMDAAELRTIIASTACHVEVQRYAKMYYLKAVQDCGGHEYITDIWGSNSQIVGTVRQAWNCVEPGDLVVINNLAMMLWQGTEDLWMNAFEEWKRLARESRSTRPAKGFKWPIRISQTLASWRPFARGTS